MGKKHLGILILIAHVTALLIYHQFAYIGHYGYDDMHYAKLAHDLLSSQVDYSDHFTYRFPIILLTALFYSIFGVADFASSIPSILFSILCLVLLYDVLRRINLKVLTIGLSLCLFSNWYIFYSDKLMPDIYVAFGFMLSLYVIYRFKYISNQSKPFKYSFLLALSLLFTFIAKATVVFILPLLIFIFFMDFSQKKHKKFWLYLLLNGSIMLVLYFVFIAWLTDDLYTRLHAINRNSYLSLCSYSEQPLSFLLERISYGFFTYMLHHSMLTAYIFLIAFLFQKKLLHFFKLKDGFSFFFSSSIILLLSSNFMSVSLTAYSPMCLDPRHYLFIVPIAAIPAACIIDAFIKNKSRAINILIVLLSFTFLSYSVSRNAFWILYVPMSFLFLFYLLLKKRAYSEKTFIAIFLIILLLTPFEMFKYASHIRFKKQREILKQEVLEKDSSYIITDAMLSRLGEYYAAFNTEKHEFLRYDSFDADTLKNKKKLLFLNKYTQGKSGLESQDLPYYARYIDSSAKLLFEDAALGIKIYELEKVMLPYKEGNVLLNSLMDFESEMPLWEQNQLHITDKIAFQSNFSNEVKEYSSTFSLPLDSLKLEKNKAIFIAVHFQAYQLEESNAMIVISIEDKNAQSYIWEAMPIKKYIQAYSHWWSIQFDIKVETNKIKKNSRLKVYLWNREQKKLFVDDFQVKLIE